MPKTEDAEYTEKMKGWRINDFFSEKEKIVFDPADVAFGSKCLSEFPLAEVVQDESFAEEISTFNDKDVEK